MNEYIGSGIVEMYVMGALSAAEVADVEQKAMLYPEIRQEIARVQHTLDNYADAHSKNPRPQVREKIMAALETKEKPSPKMKVVHNDPEKNYLTYKYLIAASLAALVVSTFASWFFYSRWNEAEDRYSSVLKDKNQLAQNYNLVKNEFDRNLSDLIVIRDPNARVVALSATDTTKHFQARVYWNPYSRQSYIDILALPEPATGQQYQLWALFKGQPVDAGVFELGVEGVQRMKDIISADAWAVTLEPRGGSPVPTMDQMYLLSKS
ncbi:MAG: anti-sigma factor [Bacteroidetes bacterium]|nr:anti-sigma factor [Bacteroidota bacterium]